METRGLIHWHGKLHIIVQGSIPEQDGILGMKTSGYNLIRVWLEILAINSSPFSPPPLLRMQTGFKFPLIDHPRKDNHIHGAVV